MERTLGPTFCSVGMLITVPTSVPDRNRTSHGNFQWVGSGPEAFPGRITEDETGLPQADLEDKTH